jgi:hypothetical protein
VFPDLTQGGASLPRFRLPGETGAFDASEAAMTTERPALRASRPAIRPVRRSTSASADVAEEVELDQILLEAYVDPPVVRRAPAQAASPPPYPSGRSLVPDAAQLAQVDDLLQRVDELPTSSVAPVALPSYQAPPQTIYVQNAGNDVGTRVAIGFAMALVFTLTAAASFTLLAKPETLARVRQSLGASPPLAAPAAAPVAAPVPVPVSAPAAAPAAAPAPVSASAVPTLAVEALPQPAIAKDSTLVTLPGYARVHRVYVDDVALANSTSPVTTKCGRHTIRIGSSGHEHELDLPCGGELILR